MKDKLKYIILIIMLVAILSVLIIEILADSCSNDVYDSILSDNELYKAVIFERGCGATTGFNTQISILKVTDDLPREAGNILILDNSPKQNKIGLFWTNGTLNVEVPPKTQIYLKNDFIELNKRINIYYKIR